MLSYLPKRRNPVDMDQTEFNSMIQSYPLVWVNFFAPWCFWSNKLTPNWLEVAERLHQRAYSQSVKFVQVRCLPSRLESDGSSESLAPTEAG